MAQSTISLFAGNRYTAQHLWAPGVKLAIAIAGATHANIVHLLPIATLHHVLLHGVTSDHGQVSLHGKSEESTKFTSVRVPYAAALADRNATMSAKAKVLCTSCQQPITSKVRILHSACCIVKSLQGSEGWRILLSHRLPRMQRL